MRGYIDQETQPDKGSPGCTTWSSRPAIARQGVGTALLARGMQHARQQGLGHMMTVVQSKNYPAIQFLARHGFRFCGYNERFYRNRDIGLYFVRGL